MNLHAADYLVHFSNILLLVSYSVRDILWLRWFAVAAAVTVIPYYLVQPDVLWPPVLWGSVFAIINLYQIVRLYMERRPVVLSADEQKLYDLAFRSLRPREFLSLALVGQWHDAAAGEKVLTAGAPAASICIAVSGSVDVRKGDRPLGTLKPGTLIGTALALTGDASAVDAWVTEPARFMCWPLTDLRRFMDKRPELRVSLQSLVSHDLARKLAASLS
ncbi:MAG TPA: Crp/Fnr family transcriptional regulator [Steroidobacteraceae bacterium]|nr:Crp/Fnr family transcriptional regulator [Steroidobacteraceae bacterium]